ncbi:MAG: hypothetical protein FOGNACKC_00511 [Anaerolineae bacterium]|nr:hypothetical protein [Anaerolineae bacterium]
MIFGQFGRVRNTLNKRLTSRRCWFNRTRFAVISQGKAVKPDAVNKVMKVNP